MERNNGGDGSPRRRRSQVAPEWTVKETLILVNEIAAVEADCSNALSAFQKWKIMSENCTALGVPRSLNQCRRKWEFLLVEYSQIKMWDLQSGSDSYWSLGKERRKELGLPENFDNELFRAVECLAREHEEKAQTEVDCEAVAEVDDMLEAISKPGSKRPRLQANVVEEKPDKTWKIESLPKILREEKPPISHTEVKAEKGLLEQKPQKSEIDEKKMISFGIKEQMMAAKLCENAELIHTIVKEEAADVAADQNAEDFQTQFVIQQGHQVITCHANLIDIPKQFHDLVHGSD